VSSSEGDDTDEEESRGLVPSSQENTAGGSSGRIQLTLNAEIALGQEMRLERMDSKDIV
jgi:hypothetical protein